ncbi:MAG: polysaccharide pyruvyl transferase family protein [Deltaproteobacteria bacterium]|nr:polysaccharide pyruvyl transferase family protein [Deltaproteobacteria bacterium]
MSPDTEKQGPGAPTVMILGATFGTDNLGVSALTAGAVEAVRQTFPAAEILLLDYGISPERYVLGEDPPVAISLVALRFSKKFYLKNNVARLLATALALRLIPFRSWREGWEAKDPTLSRIRKAPIIVALSGGDSFSDIYGIARLLYVSLPQLLVLALKKKLVLLPQTLGPFSRGFSRALAGRILKGATLVYSRDRQGLEEFQTQGRSGRQPDKFRFCYDLGFVVRPKKPRRWEADGEAESERPPFLVGFNVSGLLYRGGYGGRNDFGLQCDYRLLVEAIISYLIERADAGVILVPHVFGAGADTESDAPVCARLHEQFRPRYGERILLAEGRYDQSEIKYLIGKCHFFIGSRMHACIAAISQHIPTVSIAYSQKFKGVMETVGVERHVADPRVMGQEEIMALLEKALAEREETRRHLQSKMPEIRTRIGGLFQEIAREMGLKTERTVPGI